MGTDALNSPRCESVSRQALKESYPTLCALVSQSIILLKHYQQISSAAGKYCSSAFIKRVGLQLELHALAILLHTYVHPYNDLGGFLR